MSLFDRSILIFCFLWTEVVYFDVYLGFLTEIIFVNMLHSSIVEYYAEHEGYKCGYCGNSSTNFSHGMWAHSLSVADYQELIDRGWRRSGKYCYKPTMDVTCCPMYTIRCRVQEFKASKSQKKILKKFNRFLQGEHLVAKDHHTKTTENIGDQGMEQFVETTNTPTNINVNEVLNTEETPMEDGDKDSGGAAQNVEISLDDNNKLERINAVQDNTESSMELSVGEKRESKISAKGPDPNKGPCKKAKLLRLERRLEKLKSKGIDIDSVPAKQNKEKQISDFLNDLPIEFKNKLEIKLVRTNPISTEYLATAAETYKVYVQYQTTIHNDKPEKCTMLKFQDFLVSSPLLEEHTAGGPPQGYGSFHQQYWLSGRLIAVGVIDILPKCVSSVYFFYDPQYMPLTPGTYGALREIDFTIQLNKLCPSIQYYYMGYYIHSCRKMRYKGSFSPSDLACPETYKWIPLQECIPKLEKSPYSRLDDNIDSVDENFPKESDINFIPCWVKGTVMPYKLYKRKVGKKGSDADDEVVQYARLIGAKTIKNMILVRPKAK